VERRHRAGGERRRRPWRAVEHGQLAEDLTVAQRAHDDLAAAGALEDDAYLAGDDGVDAVAGVAALEEAAARAPRAHPAGTGERLQVLARHAGEQARARERGGALLGATVRRTACRCPSRAHRCLPAP